MPTDADTRAKGAHYLDPEHRVVKQLVAAAALKPGERVLDVGAGRGAITGHICDAVGPTGHVEAIETQVELVQRLKQLGKPGLHVIHGDVLAVRLPERIDAVVANPPYRILPALLKRLLKHGFGRAILVVPMELADRLTAQPKTEHYGRLSVEVGMLAKVEKLFAVPRKAFDPVPAVASTVIRVTPKPSDPGAGIDAKTFDKVLAAAWDGRAKTLRHALSPLTDALRIPPQDISESLAMVKGQDRRFADVSPWEWSVLGRALSERTAARKAVRDAERDARKEAGRLARMAADGQTAPAPAAADDGPE